MERETETWQQPLGQAAASWVHITLLMLCLLGLNIYWFTPSDGALPIEIEEAKISQEAVARLEQRSERIVAEAASLIEEVAPRLLEEIYEEGEANYSKYWQQLETEGQIYLKGVEQKIAAKVAT